MAVRRHEPGYAQAQRLVREGHAVVDERDDWSEHQPSTREENDFIAAQGYGAYGKWHLAIDDELRPESKGRYKFPYGDFRDVHRCAVLAAESRAGQRNYADVESAAAHLHGMLEMLRSGGS